MSKKLKPEDYAFILAQQERQDRQNALNAVQPALSQYYGGKGGITDTPFYKSLKQQKTSDTAQAYDNAEASQRMRANLSGFNYSQPVAQGAADNLENERASAMGRIGSEATLEATDPQFRAIGLKTGQASLYQPNQAFGNYASAYNTARGKTSNLWQALAQLGGSSFQGFSPQPPIFNYSGGF